MRRSATLQPARSCQPANSSPQRSEDRSDQYAEPAGDGGGLDEGDAGERGPRPGERIAALSGAPPQAETDGSVTRVTEARRCAARTTAVSVATS